MSTFIKIDSLVKKYGDFVAINNVSCLINAGEFFTILGPSGCGKTTLLRTIAGFNSIDAGVIFFDDKDVSDICVHKRNIGIVFQNYALFPHLNVFENIEYGLKARNFSKSERFEKVSKILDMMQIGDLSDKMVDELSRGQQQRVALARAIVIEPSILLMDEPLSNLDAKLRVQMRTLIKKVQKQLNITMVYVTHDQEEALAISDRIAVMNNGVILQVDTPSNIYNNPVNEFVADFVGDSNFFDAEVVDKNTLKIGNYEFSCKFVFDDVIKNVKVSIRPESIKFCDDCSNSILGKIVLCTFLGHFVRYNILLENGNYVEVNEYVSDMSNIRSEDQSVCLIFDENFTIFTYDGKARIDEL